MAPAGDTSGHSPRLRAFLVWLGFVVALGLLLFTYRYLDWLSVGIARGMA